MVTSFLAAPGMMRYDAELNWSQQTGGIIVLALTALMFFLGMYPQPIIDMIRQATLAL